MQAHSRGARARASRIVLISATIALGFVTPSSRAATAGVACDGVNDISDVQDAVNGAASGDVIRLSGTCDFTAAALQPLGGSAVVTAVFVRPGGAVSNLTIESDGVDPATIVGSGTQTAFAIGAGSADVTIRGLEFTGLARSVVAVSGPTSVRYGAAGLESASVPNVPLTGLRVRDNAMNASPPSEDESPVDDFVGVQVIGNGGGVDRLLVSGNTIGVLTDGVAPGDGVRVSGPVTRAVICTNTLNGTLDDPDQVSFSPGAESTGNAFPGGSAFADNMECTPTLAASPAIVPSGGTLTATGRAWASRSVEIKVTPKPTGSPVTKSVTADALGAFGAAFSSAELSGLPDGLLEVAATAIDPSGPSRSSLPFTVRKNFEADPPPAGTVAINDGGDGYPGSLGHEETAGGVTASWTAPDPSVEAATIWWSDANDIPSGCTAIRVPPAGSFTWSECSRSLDQGPIQVHVFWEKADGEGSPTVTDTSIKDTVVAPPTIASPTNGSTVTTSLVTVAGTTEPLADVSVKKRAFNGTFAVVQTVEADGSGLWSTTLSLADGSHTITASIRDPAGNQSTSAPPVQFTVDTSNPGPPDTTPPDAPVITTPTSGTVRPGRFEMTGTAEPGASITVYTGVTAVGSGGTDGAGNFAAAVALPAGTWPLRAKATDAAGNVSVNFSNQITVEVDTVAPELVVTTQDGLVFGSLDPVVIEGTVSDNRAVWLVAVVYEQLGEVVATDLLYGPALCGATSCPGTITWSTQEDLLPGAYDITVSAVDWFDFPPNYQLDKYPPNFAVQTLQIIKVP